MASATARLENLRLGALQAHVPATDCFPAAMIVLLFMCPRYGAGCPWWSLPNRQFQFSDSKVGEHSARYGSLFPAVVELATVEWPAASNSVPALRLER